MEHNYSENAECLHSSLIDRRRQGYGLLSVFIMGLFLLALIVSGQQALAADAVEGPLYLTGFIKSINVSTGLVTVDVRSSGCEGMRIFKADNLEKLAPYLDQRVSFFTDSSECNVKEIYTIITARGLRK